MRRRRLHLCAIALGLACACACSSGATKPAATASGRASEVDPGAQVAVIDGQPVTYGDLDKEVGAKVRQAEVEYLTKVYELRHEALEGLLTKRLLDGEAKKTGKATDDWFRDYVGTAPASTDGEIKAFYDENQSQMGGRPFEEMKPRIAGYLRQQKAKDNLGKLVEALKQTHGVQVSLTAPVLPRIEVASTGPSRGSKDAKVTIVAFSDFQCPFCSRVMPTLERILKDYDGKVRLVFRHFPLDFHPQAAKAAEAGACAADQGKFWELHDRMFGNQQKLQVEELKRSAREVGLDGGKFDQCLDSGQKKALVDADQKAGSDAGVNGTPAFFINGIFLNGAQPFEQFKEAIDREVAAANKG